MNGVYEDSMDLLAMSKRTRAVGDSTTAYDLPALHQILSPLRSLWEASIGVKSSTNSSSAIICESKLGECSCFYSLWNIPAPSSEHQCKHVLAARLYLGNQSKAEIEADLARFLSKTRSNRRNCNSVGGNVNQELNLVERIMERQLELGDHVWNT